jgi:hypothetical protein
VLPVHFFPERKELLSSYIADFTIPDQSEGGEGLVPKITERKSEVSLGKFLDMLPAPLEKNSLQVILLGMRIEESEIAAAPGGITLYFIHNKRNEHLGGVSDKVEIEVTSGCF